MMSKQTWYGCSCLSGCQETPRKVGDFYFIILFFINSHPHQIFFFSREMTFFNYIVLYYIVIKIVDVTILIELNIFLLSY